MNNYVVFMLAFAASAAAPGPEIAGLLSRALSGGMRASLPLALGIIAGKLLMLSAALAGLAALAGALGPMFMFLKYCGAAYLLWLGVKKWRSAGRTLQTAGTIEPARLLPEVGLGLVMTLSNPLAIVFYLALLPGVIDVGQVTPAGYLTLCALIVAVMSTVVFAYGLMAELARKLFTAAEAKSRIDRAAAVMMIGAAALIALR